MNKFLQTLFPVPVGGAGAIGLLLVRLVMGSAMMFHGWDKIQAPFSWMGPGAPVPGFLQALAALSEFGGGAALVLGFLVPLASLGLTCTMAFATFLVHMKAGHPFVGKGGPSYELAAVYLVLSLLFLLLGPGRLSLDAAVFGRGRKR